MLEINNQSTNFAQYASVTLTTIGGAVIGSAAAGVVTGVFCGAIAGFALGIADEYLISNQILDNHILSRTAYYSYSFFSPWASFASGFFPQYDLPIKASSFALSGITSYLTTDFISFKARLDTPLSALFTLSKILSEEEIVCVNNESNNSTSFFEDFNFNSVKEKALKMYNNEFVYNVATQNIANIVSLVVNNLFMSALGKYAGNLFASTLIQGHQEGLINTGIKALVYDTAKVVSLMSAQHVFNSHVKNFVANIALNNHRLIVNKTSSILLEDSNTRKILAEDKEEGQEIINNLFSDMFALLDGLKKLNNEISLNTDFMISLNNVMRLSPTVLLPHIIFTLIVKQNFLSLIFPESKKIAIESSEANNKIVLFISDLMERSEQISLRDGNEFMRYHFSKNWIKYKELSHNATQINQQKSNLDQAIGIFDNIINMGYFGLKHPLQPSNIGEFALVVYSPNSERLNIGDFSLVLSSTATISYFLLRNLYSQSENIEIDLSNQRIEKLLEVINYPSSQASKIAHDGGNLIFNNYSLRLEDKTIVKIDNLVFESGKRYAITGKSGCGKSTTLIDLKLGVVGAFSSDGEIYIPKNAEIMLLDQQLFIPKDSTLLETIYFPKVLENETEEDIANIRSIILSLFKELEIDEFVNDADSKTGLSANLDTQKFKLSGGQMQKIAIIQAIISNPAIIIIDESFARLDNKSVIQLQAVISKYLPNSTILVVDHKAHSHNYNNFYDLEVHFENGTVSTSEIDNTPVDNLEEDIEDSNNIVAIPSEIVDLINELDKNPEINNLELLYEHLSLMFRPGLSGELTQESD